MKNEKDYGRKIKKNLMQIEQVYSYVFNLIQVLLCISVLIYVLQLH